MEIKELQVGADGLDTKFELNGEEIKLTKLANPKELDKAHTYLTAIICEEFFELTKMYAESKGIEINEVFKTQEHLDNSMQNYIADFLEQLIKTAVVHSKTNFELFKRQREENENKRCDA